MTCQQLHPRQLVDHLRQLGRTWFCSTVWISLVRHSMRISSSGSRVTPIEIGTQMPDMYCTTMHTCVYKYKYIYIYTHRISYIHICMYICTYTSNNNIYIYIRVYYCIYPMLISYTCNQFGR